MTQAQHGSDRHDYTITPYTRPHRQTLLGVMYDGRYVHTHLDWHRPVHWLENAAPIVRLIWHGEHLLGYMGFSAPLFGYSWLRMIGFATHSQHTALMPHVWQAVAANLRAQGARAAYALVLDQWLVAALKAVDFVYEEDVITLHRPMQDVPPLPRRSANIELAYSDDASAITTVDHAAFAPAWRMTHGEIRQALRIAASANVARLDGTIVGYQISTRHQRSGHLARLAVHPAAQSRGIGAQLLDTLITGFQKRRINSMTVNTQHSNHHSQQLYHRYGFQRNGFDLGVWRYDLQE